MKTLLTTFAFSLVLCQIAAGADTTKIAFGSCLKESRPQPIWDTIHEVRPDVFLMIGDNIYGDSDDMDVLREKYERLFSNSGFKRIWNSTPFYATWDDHDYGKNDAGKEFKKKKESQALFNEFFRPNISEEKKRRAGIYDAVIHGEGDKSVQLILLDTRYFRDSLEKVVIKEKPFYKYIPTNDKSKSILGEAQWNWLEEQLRKPAAVRILVTSIEFNGEEHKYEKWYNFPHERVRLYNLIKKTKAEHVIVISGDRHRAMLSKNENGPAYPLYEITSSSLNLAFLASSKPEEPNKYRIGDSFFDENFGMIEINWARKQLTLQVRDIENEPVRTIDVPFGELEFHRKVVTR